jgi:hypothetical protein
MVGRMSILESKVTVHVVGTTFSIDSQWYKDERDVIDTIRRQIDTAYPSLNNLLINTTWFGPQFNPTLFQSIDSFCNIDNLFFLATVDPVMLNVDQLSEISNRTGAKQTFYLGNFDTQYQFTFIATLLPKYFQSYTEAELLLQQAKWIFINYNRKPRQHRIDLTTKILYNGLDKHGIMTLGKNDPIYSGESDSVSLLLGEDDYAMEGNWGMDDRFGIPHDIHTLGNMDYWQNHFLTVVGETEFLPWNNMFITEKTWKPIIGLRPFVLNGQTKIYQWLRDHGFYTFNHYWPHIEMEKLIELEVHDSVIEVIKFLSTMSNNTLLEMYADMLPALKHNRNRFFELVKEQQYKINHIFE